jgi:hypothetical protein
VREINKKKEKGEGVFRRSLPQYRQTVIIYRVPIENVKDSNNNDDPTRGGVLEYHKKMKTHTLVMSKNETFDNVRLKNSKCAN